MGRVISKFGCPSMESEADRQLPALQGQTAIVSTCHPLNVVDNSRWPLDKQGLFQLGSKVV